MAADIDLLIYDRHWMSERMKISSRLLLLSRHLFSTENTTAGPLTNNHQQFLLLFDDVDLKDWPQARNVSQGVLDNIQRIQPLFRAHQNDLRHSSETQKNINIQVNVVTFQTGATCGKSWQRAPSICSMLQYIVLLLNTTADHVIF